MGKTTKFEIIEALSEECRISVREMWKIVGTILDTMSDALERGESIELRGFGTFKIKQYGTYTARNPRTQEKVPVKPKKLPVFTVGKELKGAVNENRKTK
jgi:integration host factor subunit beta